MITLDTLIELKSELKSNTSFLHALLKPLETSSPLHACEIIGAYNIQTGGDIDDGIETLQRALNYGVIRKYYEPPSVSLIENTIA